tara:strand:- start:77 stop:673 length:597 start_codon:yes stop_codon:yes gene_type:complete
MIVSLNGQIVKKEADSVVIECNGIGYFCSITSNTYDKLGDVGNNAYVKTYMQVSENNQALFGFIDNIEYDLFVLLISVSGIGPKTALNILSSVSPEEFKRRLISSEVEMLSSLPGIGPKTARRIIVELKDKFISISKSDLPKEGSLNSSLERDAYDALLALGFNPRDINAAISTSLSGIDSLSLEDLIKESLTRLGSK